MKETKNIRSADDVATLKKKSDLYQIFRTPAHAYEVLLDSRPEYFAAATGIDPSAGDGRMIAAIVERFGFARHALVELRAEEQALWEGDNRLGGCEFVGGQNFLSYECDRRFDFAITNPPFKLAQGMVERLLDMVDGPICILQSTAWIGTEKRGRWLAHRSKIREVLNILKRPRWETLAGPADVSNVWDYSWYVFARRFEGVPTLGWLDERATGSLL